MGLKESRVQAAMIEMQDMKRAFLFRLLISYFYQSCGRPGVNNAGGECYTAILSHVSSRQAAEL
jgi:hypothetical protein